MKNKLIKHFGIRLCENQIKKLEEIAEKEERSIAAVIRIMIDNGLKNYNSNVNCSLHLNPEKGGKIEFKK